VQAPAAVAAALAANNQWGERSVVVASLTRRSSADAIRYGDVALVAPPGSEGSLDYSGLPVEPVDELADSVSPNPHSMLQDSCPPTRRAQERRSGAPDSRSVSSSS
jgi:hypothetical protein